mmetsp:Transcript_23415/g.57387  ORF Transcript_23415/g.57387 Transcript_23415/m.57387 type:complete len:385 (-) Transcript_23415:934-2088(-)
MKRVVAVCAQHSQRLRLAVLARSLRGGRRRVGHRGSIGDGAGGAGLGALDVGHGGCVGAVHKPHHARRGLHSETEQLLGAGVELPEARPRGLVECNDLAGAVLPHQQRVAVQGDAGGLVDAGGEGLVLAAPEQRVLEGGRRGRPQREVAAQVVAGLVHIPATVGVHGHDAPRPRVHDEHRARLRVHDDVPRHARHPRQLHLGVAPHIGQRVVQRRRAVRLLEVVADERAVEAIEHPEHVVVRRHRLGVVRHAHAQRRGVQHVCVRHETSRGRRGGVGGGGAGVAAGGLEAGIGVAVFALGSNIDALDVLGPAPRGGRALLHYRAVQGGAHEVVGRLHSGVCVHTLLTRGHHVVGTKGQRRHLIHVVEGRAVKPVRQTTGAGAGG